MRDLLNVRMLPVPPCHYHLHSEDLFPLFLQTRILVTHALHVLPHADWIVVLEDGAITEMGTYQELLHKKGSLVDLLDRARQPGEMEEGGTV